MSKALANMPGDDYFRHPPVFDTYAEHRAYLKFRHAVALRHFARLGFDQDGLAGLITVADPEHADTYWANPLAHPFSTITPADLIRVDGDSTETVDGQRRVNIAAFNIHAEIHRARPDVQAVIHLHTVYGRAFSAFARKLPPLTQDACPFFEDHEVFDDYTGLVLAKDDGRRIAKQLRGHKAILLKNHGLVTVGETLDAAAWWFTLLDTCCHVQLLADAAGGAEPIPAEVARLTGQQLGSHLLGWNSYQPLHEATLARNPDLAAMAPALPPQTPALAR
ncbi:bifunctional 4-hydroxy-3-prenylphenylpyruvate oxygenase/4-hydroxy-3-prenylbenzoate synthase [Streptomyces roseochromogenus]|uniref:4-hydroxy-3-prenylphenylpyruvate oxygenase/4-hydroxy-3-prenylbenzoate synthase n=2 Tax=Streptomyces roseochromogenus subsp. oscitans TaxID=149682 RepID=CLOR_STRRC|nr:bifunctional 4-hydroxy-3-prenylphenylpyruvate oxygenase/4-hydroxy-3-prenylbenzoate synthase [Streptomyces roseochromogenus]Q8GHB1.1 RecName: Full=4-hydroxy-3-prenylphenylpyruvate oxygenase/4-hydroxy-3-prenylbenzoate synthase; AltName: Full=Bifunctional non-heme iron oxygenase; AltName: Full=Clorobiocin biosynthesis protein CloR [Streptomyces roseochromogenus subsp. oscitans]AAN65240.1 putative aldolase [Streptomyces roseochromogenus subsp. oscitans DS 12.976]